MNKLFLLFIVPFMLSFIFISLSKKVCLRFNLFNKDKKPPFIGGVCFSAAFLISFLAYSYLVKEKLPFQFTIILLFSFILLFLEFLDDIKDFSLRSRLIMQLFFISAFLLYGKSIQIYFLPQWLNYLLSFLWIMGVTNAFNLLDIADGACGGVSVIVCLSFLAVSVVQGEAVLVPLFISIIGAVLAFLFFNFPQAQVFMGNSGSHFLGFLLATLSVYGDYADSAKPWSLILPLLILGFPIIDTFFLIFSRIRKGVSPLRKSDDHIFLRLTSSGFTPKRALIIIYLVSFTWGFSGALILFGINLFFFASIFLAVVLTFRVTGRVVSVR